jgi:serine phosphatase RsbU (regulator of sigma subunit)
MTSDFAPLPDPAFEASVSVWSAAANGGRAGGDWCEAFAISEEALALTVGDVAGHGETAAGTMAAMRSSLLEALRDIRVPSDVLAIANEVAFAQGNELIVTAIAGFVNYRHRTLTFANAGHPPPLLVSAEHLAFLEHGPANLPLGIFPKHRAADYAIALPTDAMLVLYTDGITEHDRDPIRGEIELVEAARRVYARSEADAARAISQLMLREPQSRDDATAMVLRARFPR